MSVRGFTLDKNDPTKRLECMYGSHAERAWCECAELADVGLYQEASQKWDEYMAYMNGYINNGRDAVLNAQIKLGLAKTRGEDDDYEWAVEAMEPALYYEDDPKKIGDLVGDIVDVHVEKFLPVREEDAGKKWHIFHADFGKASTENLFRVANAMLRLFVMATASHVYLATYDDNPHDCMQSVICELLNRNGAMEKVRPLVKKLMSKGDPTGFFKDIWDEEWKQKLS